MTLVGSHPPLSGPNMTTKTPERRARSHRRRLRRSGAVKGLSIISGYPKTGQKP